MRLASQILGSRFAVLSSDDAGGGSLDHSSETHPRAACIVDRAESPTTHEGVDRCLVMASRSSVLTRPSDLSGTWKLLGVYAVQVLSHAAISLPLPGPSKL